MVPITATTTMLVCSLAPSLYLSLYLFFLLVDRREEAPGQLRNMRSHEKQFLEAVSWLFGAVGCSETASSVPRIVFPSVSLINDEYENSHTCSALPKA